MPDPAPNSPPAPSPASAMRFEEALERLEAIIERLESGEVGLEDSIKAWEQGVGLVARCREILRAAEVKIADLTAQMGAETGGGVGGGEGGRR